MNTQTLTKVRSFQGIDEYELSNGLKVLLFADPSNANVTVNITYLVGSRHEGRGEAGMAHLLEHMLFRGTKEHPNIKGVLQDRGAQFNATTWYDRTNYFETLTPEGGSLEFALKLEADRMINSTILQSDLDAEMTVVRNEFEMGENNPVHVLHDQMMAAAYRWHNYGKSTIGNRSDIERVPATTLKMFYQNYYQPDNAVLIIAGQFEKEEALTLVQKYFGTIPKAERVLDKTYTEEPTQDGPRQVTLKRTGDMASVGLAYHIPKMAHADHAAVKVLLEALCDEPAGLLYKQLLATKQCSELFPMIYALAEPGMAMVFVRPSTIESAVDVSKRLIDLVESGCASIDDTQVERIKKRNLKRFKLSLANSKDLALKLSEVIACYDWRLLFWYSQQIEQVTLADVRRVAQSYFMESNRTLGIFTPEASPKRAVIESLDDVCSSLDTLQEDQSLSFGEAFVPTPENIEANLRRITVPKDLNVAILAKKTRGQTVKTNVILRFGNEATLTPYKYEFSFLPALLWRGTTKFDYQALRDQCDALMSTIDLDGHAGMLSAAIKSDREHVVKALALFGHMSESPAFKREEFEIVKKREIDDYEEAKSDPEKLAFRELERLKNPWPKENIHFIPSIAEKIEILKALDLDRVKEAYTKLFATDHVRAALVGDVAGLEVEDELAKTFSGLAKTPYERIARPFIANTKQDVVLHTPDKEMCYVAMGANFRLRDDHEDFPKLKMLNYCFGETMNSRLMMRIREKEGISYHAGSWLEVSRFEENASMNIYAMAAPQNVSRAIGVMKEEWGRLVSQGVEHTELLAAKESMLATFHTTLANDSYLSATLASDFESKRNFLYRKKLYATMHALTKEELDEALKTWWTDLPFCQVMAGDQDKVA